MLLNKFYILVRQQSEGGKVSALISFNKEHPIFEGHFPGHPVVPGVCMLQILREVMEVEMSQKLKISMGDNLKFLSIIDPREHREVEVSISYTPNDKMINLINLNASLHSGATTFFKFKGAFEKV